MAQSKNVSDDTAKIIDAEVKRIVEEAKTKARKIITDNIDQLHIIAKGLLEYETLTGDEITKVMNGKSLDKSEDDNNGGNDGSSSSITSIPKTGNTSRSLVSSFI